MKATSSAQDTQGEAKNDDARLLCLNLWQDVKFFRLKFCSSFKSIHSFILQILNQLREENEINAVMSLVGPGGGEGGGLYSSGLQSKLIVLLNCSLRDACVPQVYSS